MLGNKCGLLKFRAWPAPSTTTDYDTVKISGMKVKAIIDFANPGITPADTIGEVKLHHVSGTDAAERWAILLPQEGHETTVSYYKNNDNGNPPSLYTQTISLPVIKANTYYGGYNGISVGLEYVDLGLSVLWAACNVGSCTHEGYGTFFAWADTKPQTAYCWSHYPYAEDPDPTDGDTIHWEPGNNGSNLWLTKYNTKETWCPEGDDPDAKTTLDTEDDAAVANMGGGWRTPTVAEWNELINNTEKEKVLENGIGGIKFTSTKNGYTDKSIFLPFAGFYSGNQQNAQYNGDRLPVGEYWSNQIDSDKPYQAWCLYINDPTYGLYGPEGSLDDICVTSRDPSGTDDVGFIRYEGRPVRAVRDK